MFSQPRLPSCFQLVVHPDALFLETLNDLANRVQHPRTEYEALVSTALLRKLLLDSPTLVDVINRERRLKIRYLANVRPPAWKLVGGEPPVAYAIEDGFDPETAFRAEPARLSRDQLLSQIVALYRGQEITVRDLLVYAAHTAGGVHFDPPRTDQERAAQALGEQMRVGGHPAGIRTLLAVGRVVVRALEPLRQRVTADYERDRPTN